MLKWCSKCGKMVEVVKHSFPALSQYEYRCPRCGSTLEVIHLDTPGKLKPTRHEAPWEAGR